MADARKRTGDVLLQTSLQAVIDRASDGKQHFVRTDIGVDSGKRSGGCSRRGARLSRAEYVSGIKTVGSEIGYVRARSDVAVHVCAAELGIGCGDGGLCCRLVEESCIADMVCIEDEEVVSRDVP